MSINVIIETLQALYLPAKPLYILLPSEFLHVEKFAILFMGKGISVCNDIFEHLRIWMPCMSLIMMMSLKICRLL